MAASIQERLGAIGLPLELDPRLWDRQPTVEPEQKPTPTGWDRTDRAFARAIEDSERAEAAARGMSLDDPGAQVRVYKKPQPQQMTTDPGQAFMAPSQVLTPEPHAIPKTENVNAGSFGDPTHPGRSTQATAGSGGAPQKLGAQSGPLPYRPHGTQGFGRVIIL
jgi:hypothetical protein